MEVWSSIADSDYYVSNLGRIKNKKGTILNGYIHRGSYKRVDININGARTQSYLHRLIAEAFIPNPENKSFVNHINGIKTDNRVDNLEWVTSKENSNRKIFPNPGRGRSRKVVQIGLDGKIIRIWDSLTLVQNTLEIYKSAISMCCNGKRNFTGGYCWKYYKDYMEPNPNEEWKEVEFNSEKFKVSSLGRVQLKNGMISQGTLCHSGYLSIGRGSKNYLVHRLIALAFCPKKQGKDYVNHIDGNPSNNKVSNLEWVTPKENIQHAVRTGLQKQSSVKQIFSDGSFLEFPSIVEAQRTTKIYHISDVCRGLQTHAGGYRWEYIDSAIQNKS